MLFVLFQDANHCRLKYILAGDFETKVRQQFPTSILSFEFGGSTGTRHHRVIKDVDHNYLFKRNNFSKLDIADIDIPWSRGIRSAALQVKNACLRKGGFEPQQQMLFYVIHLRATDRYCVRKVYTADKLVNKLQVDFAVLYSDNASVYLMTDLPLHHGYVKVIQRSALFCLALHQNVFFLWNLLQTSNFKLCSNWPD